MGEDCRRCTAPAMGAYLCSTCGLALRAELADVPALMADVDVTRSRQDRLANPYDRHRGSGEIPLPYRPAVSDVAVVLHCTLRRWVLALSGDSHTAATRPTGALAQWLHARVDSLRCHPDAERAVDEIACAIGAARHAIDRPADRRLYLGPCGADACREEVYGVVWRRTAACAACGAEWDVERRQTWMRQAALAHLGTAPEVAGFLRLTGAPITDSVIRGYAARGRLVPRGRTTRGHPLYRVSDVIEAMQRRYQHGPKSAAS